MKKVVMYGTAYCPFCIRARQLLTAKEVMFDDLRIDEQPELRQVMQELAGGRTSVPQIFIDDQHIGGCDELHDLERAGRLDTLLGRSAA